MLTSKVLRVRSHFNPLTPLRMNSPLGETSFFFALLVLALCEFGCDDDPASSSQGEVIIESINDCIIPWEPHYLKRVPSGSTRWLPAFLNNDECSSDLIWSIHTQPTSSNVSVYSDGDNQLSRFTPLIVGQYIFQAEVNGTTIPGQVTVEVIDALERPFHNYNYYPSSRAGALIGDEVWVAGVSSPQVARMSALNGERRDPISVGQWPVGVAHAEELGLALVTHKADDTLGLIDTSSKTLIDAIWVGDEPSEVIWDAIRSRAYVSLANAGQLAVVDLNTRELMATVDAVFDAQPMALSSDGQTLVIASRRSGQSKQFPYADRNLDSERDIALINLETLETTGYILEVASTIHALRFDEEGELWVSATSNNTEGNLNRPGDLSFVHEIFNLQLSLGEAQRGNSVDLSRQDSSGGSTGVTGGFTWCDGALWITAEGANAVLKLDDSLAELDRLSVEGRPRVALCVNNTPWIISTHRHQVTRILGEERSLNSLGLSDQRSASVIEGFELFHGQGEGVGDNRSCSACHADGLSDGVIWNAGPVENRQVTRPLRWLEGTDLIGWDGYVGSVKISGFVGGSTINKRGDTISSLAMGAYLASLMPAPAATSLTRRDGELSEIANQGEALFKGTANCGSCHSGELSTSRTVLAEGLTPGKTDIPTLVDVARVGAWYKTGEMATLEETLDDTVEKFNVTLNNDERNAILRYLLELTVRHFFTLKADLGPNSEAVALDAQLMLTFNLPILNDPENLSLISLKNSDNEIVPIEVIAEGRHVKIKAINQLSPDSNYKIMLDESLLSDDGHLHVEEGRLITFTTANEPSLTMEGTYTFTAQLPFFNPAQGIFDPTRSLPSIMKIEARPSPSGSIWEIDYGQDMIYEDSVVLSGNDLFTKHLPISAGPSFLNGHPLQAEEIIDDNGDGIIDRISGKIKLTGPGLDYEDREFTIVSALDGTECMEGSEGPSPPTITQSGSDITIDWGEGLSLSLFVTSPEAQLPLGPIPVMGGDTYWALAPIQFPTGFAGPVTYGVAPEGAMDSTTTHNGPEGGATLEAGKCYKFGVLIDFVYSTRTMVWPAE